AELQRGESLVEKQVKEARTKCRSIASLLTDAPNPNSKGVLMFKKRRQRAKKYTLTCFGKAEGAPGGDSGGETGGETEEEGGGSIQSGSEVEEAGSWDPTWDAGYLDLLEKRSSACPPTTPTTPTTPTANHSFDHQSPGPEVWATQSSSLDPCSPQQPMDSQASPAAAALTNGASVAVSRASVVLSPPSRGPDSGPGPGAGGFSEPGPDVHGPEHGRSLWGSGGSRGRAGALRGGRPRVRARGGLAEVGGGGLQLPAGSERPQASARRPEAPQPPGATAGGERRAAVRPQAEQNGPLRGGASALRRRRALLARPDQAPSPTPSLPATWKYSSNIRAPPPISYNPLLSPSCPPQAQKKPQGQRADARSRSRPTGPAPPCWATGAEIPTRGGERVVLLRRQRRCVRSSASPHLRQHPQVRPS
ncbi:unnamed protein product, partial [Tetraodon nigroviridis]